MTTSFRRDALGFFIIKDPQATLDYQLNWSDANGSWLGSDTIASAVFSTDPGIAAVSSSFTNTTATVWLAGGTAGTAYNVTCRITTAAGRVDDRSFRVVVQNR